MHFNRHDICEAYYLFASFWHGGQWSDEYKIFGRLTNLGYKPRLLLNNRKNLSDNGKKIYDRLVRRRNKR